MPVLVFSFTVSFVQGADDIALFIEMNEHKGKHFTEKLRTRRWGYGSATKVFPTQAGGLEFDSSALRKEPDVPDCAYKPSAVRELQVQSQALSETQSG